jgi:hypothetical protein
MIIDREYKDMAEANNTVVISFSIAMFLLLILLLIVTYNSKCQMDNVEKFYGQNTPTYAPVSNISAQLQHNNKVNASDPQGDEVYRPVDQQTPGDSPPVLDTQLQGQCATRDRLTSADLLPLDANSKWAELNPQCAGDVQDQNYLTAGDHIGVNTVGQSRRNANLQLRYEPPNPKIPVSPWQISTIEPDSRSHGLMDIGSSPMF